ncbi:type III pantothenate kinase [Cyclobacterium marinum]|mgnify:FL=1|uniref:Type III pantothenate kinase n=1 Tax=Cyclobacterium marinum (strain ATCC 25205 / DSM 745 / LMG 13164 / NCIMB 1802) TaxID=880070 RepID=G0J5U8_CYCMS|nr:type III pantothenate kinase [Cyclobacterium marinum]AEL25399.1 putative transcriptional acitvator, Baf family [Cyclobacterium marinum DSM 745]MBI0400839.1 type III pantothenate kinase [Cyclobacterium marinum]|tara:strand:+ start:209 stop:985 length:777 start_codon:yes stop_codon:yes gene_type:complete
MFLSIDAGNSNIVFGFYQDETNAWEEVLRVPTKKDLRVFNLERKVAMYFLEKGWGTDSIDQIGMSTVVPDLEPVLIQFCERFFGKKPYVINENSYNKLPVTAMNPREIGTDLMANITAAYLRFRTACIIVDFGTALTFSVVAKEGEVIGVNIVPGIKTAINSLFNNTAKLPRVELKLPESALGKNTVHAIQAGIFYGYSGLVKGMVEAIEKETNCKYQLIVTGGMSSLMGHLGDRFNTVDVNLTLKGIFQITRLNIGN